MKVLIDADGCPVKDIVVKICKLHEIDVVIVKNICHEIFDDYCEVITVDRGRDMADIKIANKTSEGDIVITQDYGLAAMILGKKAYAINQNGLLYTNENIEMLLMKRHLNQHIRKTHKKYTKSPKRTKENDLKFEREFMKLIRKIKEL